MKCYYSFSRSGPMEAAAWRNNPERETLSTGATGTRRQLATELRWTKPVQLRLKLRPDWRPWQDVATANSWTREDINSCRLLVIDLVLAVSLSHQTWAISGERKSLLELLGACNINHHANTPVLKAVMLIYLLYFIICFKGFMLHLVSILLSIVNFKLLFW